MALNSEQFIKDLHWRYATKLFDESKKISDVDWELLSESLHMAPSSYGLQPWKFLVIQNSEIRHKLREVSWNQSQVVDCSHLVVFTTLKKVEAKHVDEYMEDIAKKRGIQVDDLSGFRNAIVGDVVEGARSKIAQHWTQRQSYIAMGMLLSTAAQMGIDACPMEGLDPDAYDKILNLEETDYASIAVVALGYRHADDKYQKLKKVRFDKERVVQLIN